MYFPDMYIPSKNLIVEVKSTYTLFGTLRNSGKYGAEFWGRNVAKFKAMNVLGYESCLMLIDKGYRISLPKDWFYYEKAYLKKLVADKIKNKEYSL